MRILLLSGYSHPSHHRKAELLADTAEVELVHILQPGNGKETGWHSSANGQRHYRVQVLPTRSLGRPNDPHRTIHWPPDFNLAAFKPDLIHCEHEQESLLAAEVALARNLAAPGVPLILYAWQNILRPRRWAVRQICAFTLRNAQHIICASHETVSVLEQQGYQGGSSIQPLFGLDRRYFAPGPNAHLRRQLGCLNEFVVGYVGRLVAEKGIDLLLQAMAQINLPSHALIIGTGPEKPKLENLARELGINHRCHFLQAVNYDSVATYLNALDALVLPSRTIPHWKEQYGRILVEAMACAIPVVGSSSGAIPEVIGEAGLIFPEGDVTALANCLLSLAEQPARRQALGQRGREKVMGQYTTEHLAEQIVALWQKVAQHAHCH